jgi:hypothetical protein
MGLAEWLRKFWDDLFYSKLVKRLELDLLMAKQDIQQLRQDKDAVIADLRAEKSALSVKVSMYELNINRRVGIDPARKEPIKPSFADFQSPPVMSSWQQEVAENEAQIAKELAEEEAQKKGATNGERKNE